MGTNRQFGLLDIMTVMSLVLQIQDHERDVSQASNDVLLKELSGKLDEVMENQRVIMERLAEMAD